jgi:hypothetical protein
MVGQAWLGGSCGIAFPRRKAFRICFCILVSSNESVRHDLLLASDGVGVSGCAFHLEVLALFTNFVVAASALPFLHRKFSFRTVQTVHAL